MRETAVYIWCMVAAAVWCAAAENPRAADSGVYADAYAALENAVYAQEDMTETVCALYDAACAAAETSDAAESCGESLRLARLSQCEELMGRWYVAHGDEESAGGCFDRGVEYARESDELCPNAEARASLAANTSQNMRTKSVGYLLRNGLKLKSFINDALDLDPYNAAAAYLQVSTYVYAPKAFTDAEKGREIALRMLSDERFALSDAERFNVYTALAKAAILDKNYAEAQQYLSQAAELFPHNSALEEHRQELPE